jgi:hypothetical protein
MRNYSTDFLNMLVTVQINDIVIVKDKVTLSKRSASKGAVAAASGEAIPLGDVWLHEKE